jgi:hypothetical protein
MSFGVLLSGEWGLRPVEQLLHEVDTALYEAKAAGRNCLRTARPAQKPNRHPHRCLNPYGSGTEEGPTKKLFRRSRNQTPVIFVRA